MKFVQRRPHEVSGKEAAIQGALSREVTSKPENPRDTICPSVEKHEVVGGYKILSISSIFPFNFYAILDAIGKLEIDIRVLKYRCLDGSDGTKVHIGPIASAVNRSPRHVRLCKRGTGETRYPSVQALFFRTRSFIICHHIYLVPNGDVGPPSPFSLPPFIPSLKTLPTKPLSPSHYAET